jgi:hypothetical protein
MMCTAGTQHIEAREFQEWLAAAKPGERIAYAKGALAASIHTAWQAEHPDAQGLSALQEATWRAGAKGQVYLVQRNVRNGPLIVPHPHLQRQIHRGAFFGASAQAASVRVSRRAKPW